jgi:hypothetical protein
VPVHARAVKTKKGEKGAILLSCYVNVTTLIGLAAYLPLAVLTQNATKSQAPTGRLCGTVAVTL